MQKSMGRDTGHIGTQQRACGEYGKGLGWPLRCMAAKVLSGLLARTNVAAQNVQKNTKTHYP